MSATDPRGEAWWRQVRICAAEWGVPEAEAPLVAQALTHRSLSEAVADNERLEFLGDSVLELLVCEHLYRTQPEAPEGLLTKLKARWVSEPSLVVAARHLSLGERLAVAPADEAAGARERPGILGDAFEAVLAAVYLSRGLEAARVFVTRNLLERVDPTEVWDHKSRLQEWTQEHYRATPTYHTELADGPAHAPSFRSAVAVAGEALGEGTGRSKQAAEQAAAEVALGRLQPG